MGTKKEKRSSVTSAVEDSCRQCLRQAEICVDQAREAARKHRFRAACGLFSTAIQSCQRAVTLGGEACLEARERLAQLTAELSAYRELAKSMERPFQRKTLARAASETPAVKTSDI